MSKNLVLNGRCWVVYIVLFLSMPSVFASHPGQYQAVDDIAVYLAVIPAEMLLGHPREHPESAMHLKSKIEGINQHHIMVSLFSRSTGIRLQNANISARVQGKDFDGPYKPMEAMIMGGVSSYGNYFNVPQQGAYRVEVEIKREGMEKVVKAIFYYGST